jgi:hypothetical protein
MKMDRYYSAWVEHLDKHTKTRLAGILWIDEDNDLARIGWPEFLYFSLAGWQHIFRQINLHLSALLKKSGTCIYGG